MLFHIDDDALTIKLQGWEAVWGLKRRLVIAKPNVANVGWHAEYRTNQSMFRLGGTALPGVLYAGSFRASDGRRFIYLNRAHGLAIRRHGIIATNVLVIDLDNAHYRQLLLTCPEDMAEQIKLWWTARKHT